MYNVNCVRQAETVQCDRSGVLQKYLLWYLHENVICAVFLVGECNIPPVEARAGKAVPDRASTGGITF